MNKRQINTFQAILFCVITNAFLVNILSFSELIKLFKQNTWYLPLLFIPIMILLALPFKNIPKSTNLLKNLKSNLLMRVIIFIYCLIITSTVIFFAAYVFHNIFYPTTPIMFFVAVILLTVLYLGLQNITTIINISTIFLVIIVIIYILVFINILKRPIRNILPTTFELSMLLRGLIVLIFPLQIFLLALHNPHLPNGLNKKTIIISSVLSLLYYSFFLYDSISLVGHLYYDSLFLGSIFRSQFLQSNMVFENNDLLMLYIIAVGVVFQAGFLFNTMRLITFSTKQKLASGIIGALIFIFCYLCFHFFEFIHSHWNYGVYIILSIVVIIYLYIIIQSRKVKKNEYK